MDPARALLRLTRLGAPALLSLALLAAPGCGRAPAEARSVILISLDTLRADRLSCHGYGRPTSPHIDELARQGALFENAFAEAPWTLPSHATMLTGLFPASHGATLPSRRLTRDSSTLAEVFARHGYVTLGLTEGGYLARDYGFGRGFEVYSDNRPDLATTLDSARELLAQIDRETPYFLFLHTYDIHCPYEPPAEHVELFETRGEDPVGMAGSCGADFNAIQLTVGQVRAISNRYDASIHAVDALLGAFFAELEARGAFEHTYVVVTSDHGEQLYEHGRIGHERTVHRETLRIPWIVRGPGVASRRIRATAGLVDLAPTLIELVGFEVPGSMEGRSRAPWVLGNEPFPTEGEARVSELSWKADLASVITPTHQLILDRETGRSTLYEFPDALGETVLESGGYLERELRGVLEQHRARVRPPDADPADELEPPAEQLERLRQLGYGE